MLVVHALDDLAKSSFADDFDELVSVGDVVILLDLVVPLFIIESVVYQSFELRWLYLRGVVAQVVNVLVFLDFVLFKVCEVLLRHWLLESCAWVDRELDGGSSRLIDG